MLKLKDIENRIEEIEAELELCDEKEYEKSLLSRLKAYKTLIEEGEYK